MIAACLNSHSRHAMRAKARHRSITCCMHQTFCSQRLTKIIGKNCHWIWYKTDKTQLSRAGTLLSVIWTNYTVWEQFRLRMVLVFCMLSPSYVLWKKAVRKTLAAQRVGPCERRDHSLALLLAIFSHELIKVTLDGLRERRTTCGQNFVASTTQLFGKCKSSIM